jgi:diguanylate cyclase (GGDEF)-like protein
MWPLFAAATQGTPLIFLADSKERCSKERMPAKQKSATSVAGNTARHARQMLPAPASSQDDSAGLKVARTSSRALAMRLAAEVERLAAELAASRARIDELQSRVDTDPLTETLNRRGFERELKRSLAYVKRYGVSAALIYLDLDGFKAVNDRYGHSAGDAVLKAVAAVLIRNVRSSDVVARIGGDEFVALIWNVDEAEAAAKAAALEIAVGTAAVRFGGARLNVGASAGGTVLAPLDTPVRALARADAAMYARKIHARKIASKTSLRAGNRSRNQAMISGVS